MKLSDTKTIEMNKLRAEMRTKYMDTANPVTEAEQRAYDDRAGKLEKEINAALTYEGGQMAIAEAEHVISDSQVTAEQREFRRMVERADGDDFLRDAALGTNSGGAAGEMRKHLLDTDDPRSVPLAALLPRDAFNLGTAEERADVSTSLGSTYGGTDAENLAARVFQGSAVAFLGVQSPTVQPGSKTYNMVLTGATADVRLPGVGNDSVAGTVRNTDIVPARVTARMTVAREDLSIIPGLLAGWQADLRGALMLERDRMVLNGQAAVNNVSPLVEGILRAVAETSDTANVANYSDYLNYADDVDGYSDDGSNIRMIANAAIFKHARGLSVGPAASAFALLRDRPEMGPGRFRQSEAMPDSSNANIGDAITARVGHRGAVSPVWNRLEIINDPFSNASEGLIHLTAYMLTNVGIADPKVFRHLQFKTA